MAGMMDKIKEKVHDMTHSGESTSTTDTTGTHTGTTGTHPTGTTGTHTSHSDPTGPHDTRTANKLDPRVDSDRIGAAGNTQSAGGATHTGQYGSTTGHSTTGMGSHSHTTHGSDPTGPHDSRMANKMDPRVDSDRIGGHGNTASAGGASHTGYGGAGIGSTGHNTHSDPTGPHDSRAMNKLDPRVDSDKMGGRGNTQSAGGAYGDHTGLGSTGHSTGHSTGYGTGRSDPTGPHDSRTMNKLDPRVDSDRIGGSGNTQSAGGAYGDHTGLGSTGHSTGHSTGYGTGRSDPTGPHDSRTMNKLDPRVDSDRIGGSGNTQSAGGAYGDHTGLGSTGHSTGHSTGYGTGRSDPTGPHDSRTMNKLDPRVDSDRIGGSGNTQSAGGAYGDHTGYGSTGHSTGTHTGTHNDPRGPHQSKMGNAMDPTVDRDTRGTQHHLPGPADHTAGPHKSDMANKMDPRVDSDLDGSKRLGGDKTFG